MLYRFLIFTITLLSLSACNISGTGEKGPFKSGSIVTVSKLNNQAVPIQNKTVVTDVEDNQGHYSANQIEWSGWSQINVSGEYFNEYANSDSGSSFSLDAITKKDRKFDKANVHLFSHLAAARIRHLVDNGQNRTTAWKNAQSELKQTFGLTKISRNIHNGVEQLSLSKGNGKYRKDNAILLLFTGSFLANGGDNSLLALLATDFSDDGMFNDVALSAFQSISQQASEVNLLTTLSNNLKQHGSKNPPNAGDMPNLPDWVIQNSIDTTPPNITIEGANPINVILDSDYEDAGATATDNVDETVIVTKLSNVDTTTVGEYSVIYTATDSSNNTSTETRIVNVINPQQNQAPIAEDQTVTVDEDSIIIITLTATDPDGDSLSYETNSEPSDGALTQNSTNRFTYTPNDNFNGSDSFEFIVSDGELDSNAATVDIDVTSINDDPTANAGADVSITLNDSVTLSGSGSDIDGDSLSYSWSVQGDELVLSTSSSFNFTPTSIGSYTLVLTVTDNNDAMASDSLVVEVSAAPQSMVMGTILEADGSPISGATISVYKDGEIINVNGTIITSNSDGQFDVSLNTSEEVTLRFELDGYATQVLPVKSPSLTDGFVNLDIMMIARGEPKTVNASIGGTISGNDGASVEIIAGSFVDSDGQEVTDNIVLTITPVNVATPAGVASFPGEFAGIANGDTEKTPIISYGTVEYNFIRESTGEKVQLANEQTAKIQIPIYNKQKQEGGEYIVGDSIALWSLNESTGIWVQEGTGTVVNSAESPTELALEANVFHFTWWNCDVTMNPAKATITVIADQEGTALIKARTDGNIGFRPTTVDTVIEVNDTSRPLDVPSNGETCFWAEINFIDGTSGSTIEQCFSPNVGEPFDVVLSLSTLELAITSSPSPTNPINGFINFPIEIVKLRALTSETSVGYTISGALPSGLSLSSTSSTEANISGIPTESGDFIVTITGTDSEGNISSIDLDYSISSDALPAPVATGPLNFDVSFYLDQGTNGVGNFLFYNISGDVSDYSFVTSAALGCNSLPPANMYLEESTSPNPDLNGEMQFWVSPLDSVPTNSSTNYCIEAENAAGSDILVVRVFRGGESFGLEWMDNSLVTTNTLNWDSANSFCQNLTINGVSDWRLPSYNTLSRYNNIAINNHPSNRYWSSSTSGADRAWFHDFNVGDGGTQPRTSLLGVRCVRGFNIEEPQ